MKGSRFSEEQISEGNVYVGEVDGAARTQKFLRYGATGCSGMGNAEVGKYLDVSAAQS